MIILLFLRNEITNYRKKTLTNKLYIVFFSTSISFCSFSLPSAVYLLLQPMLILTVLSWCHNFQLHFMSIMPQIKGMFIKIECFKIKTCPSQKKTIKVHGSNITSNFFHMLPCTEFYPCLIRVKGCWKLEFLHQSLAHNIVVASVIECN